MNQNFKIIVWGLGTNGKNLVELLNPENVIAIIDSNKDKVAIGLFQSIPIITFDTYLKEYRNVFIVITAMNYHNIVNELVEYGIKKYFILNENKVALAAFGLIKTNQFIKIYKLSNNRNYYISGVNLFSVYLYRYLVEHKISVNFILSSQEQREMLDILLGEKVINGYTPKIEDSENAVIIKTNDETIEEKRDMDIIEYEYINKIIYQSWKKELENFKNCHSGKRIFIVATGPSIQIEDLDKLEQSHELTISMNGIIYLLEKTVWRPNYYVISDGEMIRLYETKAEKEYLEGTEKFFSDNYLKFWNKKHDSTYHCFRQVQNPYDIRFSSDFSERVYAGFSVVYACIQLAAYMGAKEIYLLGCDFSFSQDLNNSSNHCYGKASKFYTFNFDGVLKGYECAKKYAENHGLEIYNATRGGKLELFERVDFDSLFN